MTSLHSSVLAQHRCVASHFYPQSYPQVAQASGVFGDDHQIAGRQGFRAEGADLCGVLALLQVQGAVEHQPQLQRLAEQAAQQFEVADVGQSLPAARFEVIEVHAMPYGYALQCGQVAAVVGEGFVQPGGGQGGAG